jgi:ABC-type branched-subunit amino acid transport system ATPase component
MLKKLELHNFKSHHQTQFNFDDSRLQAIIGQNSSGKTSVLQSLYYLSRFSKATDANRIIVNDLLDVGTDCGTVNQSEMIVVGSGYWENDSQENWQFSCEFKKISDDFWKPISRTWINNGKEIVIPSVQEQSSSVIIPPDLKFSTHLKLNVGNLAKASYSEAIIPEIKIDGSGLAPTLDYLRSEAPDRFQAIQEMLQQIVPGVRRIGVRRAKVKIDRQRSIEVDGKSISYEENQEVVGQEIVLDMNTGDRIPAHAISEGTMLTLGLLTVLINPKQPNLVLLDDIEQGLHPKAQRELITVFKQIIKANPNLQIIFTTHSPYIIDELEPSQVHVLSNSKSGFTHVKRLDEHPDSEWAKQTLTTGEFWNAEGEDWVVDGDVND